MERITQKFFVIKGATVEVDIIVGGLDDGLSLFENNRVRTNKKD